jgi:ribose 5-phosphate isomerase B
MKKLITEELVIKHYRQGSKEILVDGDYIITTLARDRLNDYKMTIKSAEKTNPDANPANTTNKFKVAVGSDHPAFKTKKMVIEYLKEKGYSVDDRGTYDEKSCDYPDFAIAVAKEVISGRCDFGICFDATGIPSAITANKIKGIRAATCYNEFSAWSARNHNNANVLVMGAMTLGPETIKSIIDKWFSTDFAGGRHQRRLDKISALEK